MTNNEWSDDENSTTVPSVSEMDPPEEMPFYYADRYLYDGVWYHINFPENWAKNHSYGTGPLDCANCAYFGSVNGVVIGYCINCADLDYQGDRGRGFIDIGVELDDQTVREFDSAFDTYLKGVDVSTIRSIEEIIPSENAMDVTTEEETDIDNYSEIDDNTNSILYCHFEGGYNDF